MGGGVGGVGSSTVDGGVGGLGVIRISDLLSVPVSGALRGMPGPALLGSSSVGDGETVWLSFV